MKQIHLTLVVGTSLLFFSALQAFVAKAESLSVTQSDRLAEVEKKPLAYSQILSESAQLVLGDPQLDLSSKSYYFTVSGSRFNQGVEFFTDASEAVIRVTPLPMDKQKLKQADQIDEFALQDGEKGSAVRLASQLEPGDLEVISALGSIKGQDPSMSLQATSQQMNAAHPALFKNTAAFKLSAAMGKGRFTLKTAKALQPEERYMVHVFDKNSSLELTAKTRSINLKPGDLLSLSAQINDKARVLEAAEVTLISPQGEQWELPVTLKSDELQTDWPVTLNPQAAPGELWKLVVLARTKSTEPITRIVEMAIDLNSDSASLTSSTAAGSGWTSHIQVNQPGRFELRGWIFGLDQNGKMQPLLLHYQAEWLEPGLQAIRVNPDFSGLAGRGIKGPFYLNQIQLLDQSRLALLQTENKPMKLAALDRFESVSDSRQSLNLDRSNVAKIKQLAD